MMKLLFQLSIFFWGTTLMNSQSTLPRLFFDVPSFAIVAPDVENVKNKLGLNVETAMNVGTHWGVARLGGGLNATVDPKSNDLESSILTNPYTMLEVGLGKYRTNGNQCSRTNQNAFTAMLKGGLRYTFETRDVIAASEIKNSGLDYTIGAEFGFFRIRDVFKNSEVVLQSHYSVKAKTISVAFGYKMFLNLRANRE
jgi:hypothetical protein